MAYSNIDFNLLCGLGTFDSADTIYSTIFAVGDATREDRVTAFVPALSEFPQSVSVYFVPSDDVFTDEDIAILNGLDALHAYYDANRAKLQQARLEREQKRLAAEQWRKDHPPVPKDEVLFIWKKPRASAPSVNSSQGGPQP